MEGGSDGDGGRARKVSFAKSTYAIGGTATNTSPQNSLSLSRKLQTTRALNSSTVERYYRDTMAVAVQLLKYNWRSGVACYSIVIWAILIEIANGSNDNVNPISVAAFRARAYFANIPPKTSLNGTLFVPENN
uniref:Uncharacterized protein n=1 Tax=Vespula pensylvanica TaxID=30213 RepID=A0A834PG65_VESPE|nr:hypothetical protein H0235_001667 [Vespula pensylvanica]